MNYGGINQSNTDYVTVMTYEDFAALQDKMDQRRKKRRAKDRENRVVYFKRQRFVGSVILLVGAIAMAAGCGFSSDRLQFFGGIVGMIGLYVMLTKQMIIIDRYYLECQDRINEL